MSSLSRFNFAKLLLTVALLGAGLFSFQNCSTGFETLSSYSADASSAHDASRCVPGNSRFCPLDAGTRGSQSCGDDEQWGSCLFESCEPGFFQSGNLCLPQVCAPSSVSACVVPGGSGMQTCAIDGSKLNPCIANLCQSGFYLDQGACFPNQCNPGASYVCPVPNGMGTKTCSSDGRTYSACSLVTCNPGFYKAGAVCVAQVCSPNSQQSCAVANGIGAQTCNDQGSALGACMPTSCNPGYVIAGNQCVRQQVCTPNSVASCPIPNGAGQRTCSADGFTWGECLRTTCNAGYIPSGNSCIPRVCAPNTVLPCTVPNGTGQKTCSADGSAYGSCLAIRCNFGYTLSNGQCVPNVCNPGQSYTCNVPNGTGRRTCNLDGQTYTPCALQTCNSGYYQSGESCLPQVCSPYTSTSCPIANGLGSQRCNAQGSAYGACGATQCNPGFQIQNGQCVPSQICTPGRMENCAIPNGAGTRVCAADGFSWGQCMVTTCNANYIINGNTCLFSPICMAGQTQTCALPNGSGVQTCIVSSSGNKYGSCVLQACNTGYVANNNQCILENTGIGAVDPTLPVDKTFYRKQMTVNGLPIIGSAAVSDAAFFKTRETLSGMFASKPELWPSLRKSSAGAAYFIIVGADEPITTIPEYRHLANDPNIDWNARARGFGGTWGQPITSAGEENLLCIPGKNRYYSSIAIHETGHTVMNVGLNGTSIAAQIVPAFQNAKATGKWANTYSLTNDHEYFAEGASIWFDGNPDYGIPAGNGIFNHIYRRDQLISYDPPLANILSATFGYPAYKWTPRCR